MDVVAENSTMLVHLPWIPMCPVRRDRDRSGAGASHPMYVSRPKEVAALIERAATHKRPD